jgi:serine phosphatase RsbU (regulator of sigma subunit)
MSDQMLSCVMENPDLSVAAWRKLDCMETIDLQTFKNQTILLGFPLTIKNEKFGVMLTKAENVQPDYFQKRIELIKGVAQQITLAIQNERLKEEMVGRERIEREFQLARQIQKTFLPQSIPSSDGWGIDLRWRTAREVGGDFYDVFRTSSGKIALAIADVSDKGMPAALYMTVTRTLIRSISQTIDSPAKVLDRVNDLLVRDSQDGMFVTCIFALLDPETGVLDYAIAGHNLPLIFRNEKHEVEKLSKGGIALGVVENYNYEDCRVTINAGDNLLLYTDGVTEAFSSSGELFSESRLIEAVKNQSHDSAHQFLQDLEDLIDTFRQGEPASDDLTMIAIHREKKTPA